MQYDNFPSGSRILMRARRLFVVACLLAVSTTLLAEEEPGQRSLENPRLSYKLRPECERSASSALPVLGSDDSTMPGFLRRIAGEMRGIPAAGQASQKLKFGQRVDRIGTFDHRSVWIGWNASFSETYLPFSENYAWVVYFAPEGVYLALAESCSAYSNVDLFAAIGYFVGGMVSPAGDVLDIGYIDQLSGVSFSLNFGLTLAPGLSVSADTGVTLFRVDDHSLPVRAIQYNAGSTVSAGLLPVSPPGSVSLEYWSQVARDRNGRFVGFYPIIEWDIPLIPGVNPINLIVAALEKLAESTGSGYNDSVARQFARLSLPFMSSLQTDFPVVLSDDTPPSLAEYFGHFLQTDSLSVPPGSPRKSADYLITLTEQWLQSGDTTGMPEAIREGLPATTPPPEMRALPAATGLGFELGYKHGYDASGRDDTIYADCVVELACAVGKTCRIDVTGKELSGLVPNSRPQDFEGVPVIFDNPPDRILTTQATETAIEVEKGVASYRFVPVIDAPFALGIRVEPTKPTGNKRLELCPRVVNTKGLPSVFVEPSTGVASEQGKKPGEFVVYRNGDDKKALAVRVTWGGTAVNGKDYSRLPNKVKIPAGKSSTRVRIKPRDDRLPEGEETVTLTLSPSGSYGVSSPGYAVVRIEDND